MLKYYYLMRKKCLLPSDKVFLFMTSVNKMMQWNAPNPRTSGLLHQCTSQPKMAVQTLGLFTSTKQHVCEITVNTKSRKILHQISDLDQCTDFNEVAVLRLCLLEGGKS